MLRSGRQPRAKIKARQKDGRLHLVKSGSISPHINSMPLEIMPALSVSGGQLIHIVHRW